MAENQGRSAPWGVVAGVSGACAVATWIQALAAHAAFVPWAAAASAFSLATTIGIYRSFALSRDWPAIRHNRKEPPVISVGANVRMDRPEGHNAPAEKATNTDRWKLTYTTSDVAGMAQLGQQSFDHPAYMRSMAQTPPWARFRAAVACGPLGETPGWQELRARFLYLLAHESIRELIYQLAEIPDVATWRPRATHRRSWLQADLTVEDQAAVPAASAVLFLPENKFEAGLLQGCAELVLHVDFVPRAPVTTSGQLSSRRPSYWRKRFEEALALPGELADWLDQQLGLETFGEPAAQCGIMLQARQSITEMVDVSGIRVLPAPYTPKDFTGWAVAGADGKTRQELATQMMLDLSERVLHLDGTVEEMSGVG